MLCLGIGRFDLVRRLRESADCENKGNKTSQNHDLNPSVSNRPHRMFSSRERR